MYEIDEVTEFVDGGRKQLKISPRANPVVVYGGTWKLLLDKGLERVTELLLLGNLSAKEMGLFLFLVQEMGPGNRFELTQKQIAEKTGMTQSNVSRALLSLGIADLVRGKRVSPLVVTKGRTEDYEATLAAWQGLGAGTGPREFGNTTVKGD